MESLNIYTISMYYTWSNSGFTHTNPRRPRKVKHEITKVLPDHRFIAANDVFNCQLDLKSYLKKECVKFDAFVAANDVGRLIARYPVKETRARGEIASQLGFKTVGKYEMAVRKMLVNDGEARNALTDLFGNLAAVLSA